MFVCVCERVTHTEKKEKMDIGRQRKGKGVLELETQAGAAAHTTNFEAIKSMALHSLRTLPQN